MFPAKTHYTVNTHAYTHIHSHLHTHTHVVHSTHSVFKYQKSFPYMVTDILDLFEIIFILKFFYASLFSLNTFFLFEKNVYLMMLNKMLYLKSPHRCKAVRRDP